MHAVKQKNYFVSYIKEFWKTFISSFTSFNLQQLFVILADLLFFAVSFGVIYLIGIILSKKALKLPDMQLAMLDTANAQAATGDFKQFLILFVVLLVITLVFILFNWAFTRYCIWNLTIHGKFVFKKFLRFVAANLLWFLMWLLPFIYAIYPVFVMVKQNLSVQKPPLFVTISLLIIVICVLHFTYLYFIGFIRKQKIGKAFAYAFKTGVTKIHKLLLPYLMLFLILVIISVITLPLNNLSQKVSLAVAIPLILAYLAWVRLYISKTVLAIK
jgi:hypothetical protein